MAVERGRCTCEPFTGREQLDRQALLYGENKVLITRERAYVVHPDCPHHGSNLTRAESA